MYMPALKDATSAATSTAVTPAISSFIGQAHGGTAGGWSSLIGVITAIIGNILISFALNTQRYAHLRLSRDREAVVRQKPRTEIRTDTLKSSYSTQRTSYTGGPRSRKLESNGNLGDMQEESVETDPLITDHDGSPKTSEVPDRAAKSMEKDGEMPQEKSYLKSPIWWLGISLMVLGEAGNFLAYGFAPASIVSPLGVVALISNCIIAPLLLGEDFRYRDGFGVIVAIAGCVVVVLSASASNPKLTPEAIWNLVATWEFETYLGLTCFVLVILAFLSNKYGQKTILIDLGLVALFGGYTALSTKGIASLLTYKIWRVVTFPITYLLLAVLVFTAVMQIKYVNRALQRFNATMVIPTQFVLFTISVILGSAVLYRDFERENTEDAVKFVAGCALTFFGVWCITSGRRGSSETEEDKRRQQEETMLNLSEESAIPETRENDASDEPFLVAASSSFRPGRRISTSDTRVNSKAARNVGEEPGDSPTGALDLATKSSAEHIHDIAPATASAIHVSSLAPLMGHDIVPQKKPPMHATTSEPTVPTLPATASLRPQTPANRAKSSLSRESPSRPSPNRHGSHLDPNVAQTHKLNARHSVANFLPGPLTSPLSGSLSAIVAEELRRGVDKSPSRASTLNRKRKAQRPSVIADTIDHYEGSSAPKRHSIASGTETDFENDLTADLSRVESETLLESGGGRKRIRSLSATLGDLFRQRSGSTKQRQDNKRHKTRDTTAQDGTPAESSRPRAVE